MYLFFLIRFWFSRFGEFNSRLAHKTGNLIPGFPLREFAGKELISPAVFGHGLHFGRENRNIPCSTGITGNSVAAGGAGAGPGWLTLAGRLDHVAGALVHLQPR
jgi:hypothetical protein